jgi:uncharacterized membrane protein YhhN
MTTALLPWLTLVAALAAVGAGIGLLPGELVFVAKPAATIAIIAWAWPRGRAEPRLRRLVLIGLVLSLAGDVALLWPQQGFLPGLIAFLLAHLAYIAAFCQPQRFAGRRAPFVAYALVAGVILALLWPGVPGGLRAPVVAYVLCLASMAAQAAVVWLAARGTAAEARWRLAAIGGALFVVSDALLATNKFASPLPLASLWILASYWVAQWCIASSLPAGGAVNRR